MEEIMLDNADGDAPNAKSTPLPAAHNSDGFGLANNTLVILRNSTVLNQDDCVAITSGTGYTVSKMICVGGHGLSIGSIGGKGDGDPSKNEVRNVLFEDSMLYNQQNGIRIKTNAGETGLVKKYRSPAP
jgi:polygalacturonase